MGPRPRQTARQRASDAIHFWPAAPHAGLCVPILAAAFGQIFMQHPLSPPSHRSPEVLQHFRSILAITAATYGLHERPGAQEDAPGRQNRPARQAEPVTAPDARAGSRKKPLAVAS